MNRAEVKRRQTGDISNILALITIWVIGQTLGDNCITYMAVAAEACALFWVWAGGSLADTLGKLLRSRKNKGQYKNAARMRNVAFIFHSLLGLLGSLILLILAEEIAEGIFQVRYSAYILRFMAPVVLLRTVSAALLGCFQGEGSELPAAAAGVLRQALILIFGLLFSGLMKDYGEKVSGLLREENFTAMYGGMGVALAVVAAEGVTALGLFLLFRVSRRSEARAKQDGLYTADSFGDCVASLCTNRWQRALLGFLGVLPLAAGAVIYIKGADSETQAAYEYGIYAGRYLVACGIAVLLVSVFTLPAAAKVFASLRKEETRYARFVFQSGMHVCLAYSVFASAFLIGMGEPLAEFLSPENEETMLRLLQGGAAAAGFLAVSWYFGRILYFSGKRYPLLAAAGAGDVIYMVTVTVTQGVGKAGVLSLAYGGVAGSFALCILLGLFACRQMRIRMDWLNLLIVPIGAGGAAGIAAMLVGKGILPHLGGLVTTLAGLIIMGALYWVILLFLKNFREQELEVIPGGRLILALGQMLRVY